MPRLAANLSMLYGEHEFLDRFGAAGADGFEAVEFLFPYPFEVNRLADALHMNRLSLVLHNLPAGRWDEGERGIACLPDRVGEFQDGVGKAIAYAKALGCPQVNCLIGIPPRSTDPDTIRRTVTGNLAFAAKELSQAGIRLLIEPINRFDIPGFWLNHADQAIALMEECGSDNIYLQYDIYHQQRTDGELAATFRRYREQIGHIQLADNPGRNEPGTGEINFPFLFDLLDREGYSGWIGCEYRPLTSTSAGLDWARSLLGAPRVTEKEGVSA